MAIAFAWSWFFAVGSPAGVDGIYTTLNASDGAAGAFVLQQVHEVLVEYRYHAAAATHHDAEHDLRAREATLSFLAHTRAVLGVDRARNCARHSARPPPPPRFVEQSVAAQPVPVPVTAPGGEKKDKWKAWVEHWRSMRAQQRDGTLQLGAQPKQKSDVSDP